MGDFGSYVPAAHVVERLRGWHDQGAEIDYLSSHGATYYDLPFIVAVVFVVAATIVVLTLVADLAYGLLDPRIRVRHAAA